MRIVPACLQAVRIFVLSLLLGGIAVPAFAQADTSSQDAAGPQATAPQPSVGELKSLVRTLENPQQRQALISDIQTLIAVREARHGAASTHAVPGSTLVAVLSAQAARIGAGITEIAALVSRLDLTGWLHRFTTDPELRAAWAEGMASLAGVLAVAFLAAFGVRLLLRPLLTRLHDMARGPVWERSLAGGGAVLLGLLPALVLLAAGYAALAGAQAAGILPDEARAVALAALNAGALVRAIRAGADALLVPGRDGARFLPIDEAGAEYALIWVLRLSRFTVYGAFALGAAEETGLNEAAYEGLLKFFGLVLLGLLTMLILQNHGTVARAIRGKATAQGRGIARLRVWFADSWHIAAILYLFGSYGVWAADMPGGFAFLVRASVLSFVVLALARLIDSTGGMLTSRFLSISPEMEQRLPGLQRRANLYAPILTVSGRVLLYGVAALLVLQSWGLGGLVWFETSAGQRLIGGLITIAIAAVFAVALWEVVALAAEFYVTRPGADGTPVEHSARIRTLLPLFRKTFAIVLGISFALIALATMGVNIAPLLAGAGIVGVAVGFGAQSLVKDVITGIFVLMQDAISVGDVVTVAGNSGLVEQISIRSIRLRNVTGTVIIIPFSEVTTVQNMTKDFSYALFEIGVAYRENVDHVIEVVTALGAELLADGDYASRILEPIEILGLDRFADSAVIVKARIKTRPSEQWTVMRAFNARMKRRFDELGIEIPFPHQTIYFGEDRQGNAPPVHVRLAHEEMSAAEPAERSKEV